MFNKLYANYHKILDLITLLLHHLFITLVLLGSKTISVIAIQSCYIFRVQFIYIYTVNDHNPIWGPYQNSKPCYNEQRYKLFLPERCVPVHWSTGLQALSLPEKLKMLYTPDKQRN